MDLDMAIRKDSSKPANDANVDVKAKFKKWKKANCIALLVIKKSTYNTVRGGIPDSENAKKYLASIHEKFKELDKAEIGNLINKFMIKKYNDTGCVFLNY